MGGGGWEMRIPQIATFVFASALRQCPTTDTQNFRAFQFLLGSLWLFCCCLLVFVFISGFHKEKAELPWTPKLLHRPWGCRLTELVTGMQDDSAIVHHCNQHGLYNFCEEKDNTITKEKKERGRKSYFRTTSWNSFLQKYFINCFSILFTIMVSKNQTRHNVTLKNNWWQFKANP